MEKQQENMIMKMELLDKKMKEKMKLIDGLAKRKRIFRRFTENMRINRFNI